MCAHAGEDAQSKRLASSRRQEVSLHATAGARVQARNSGTIARPGVHVSRPAFRELTREEGQAPRSAAGSCREN